jgi:hypothetical protein
MITNGLEYQIRWEDFTPGTSFFIPARDTKAAVQAMKREATRLEFEFIHKVVIEDGVRGIRVWRL